MVASDWTMQRLADLLNAPVDRPKTLETTALGAAYLAGRQIGFYPDLETFSKNWALDQQFSPNLGEEQRERKYRGWKMAISRTLSER